MLHGGGGGGAAKRAGAVAFAVPDTPVEGEPRTASEVVSDVLLYHNPPLTYLVAAAGVLALAAAWFALRGAHGLTVLTGRGRGPGGELSWQGCWGPQGAAQRCAPHKLGVSLLRRPTDCSRSCPRLRPPSRVGLPACAPTAFPCTPDAATCYVLLADLALNFLRSLISKQWQEAAGWAGSDAAAAVAQRAADGVAALARLHDAYLLCRNPVVALKTGATLWALAVLGSYLRWGPAACPG